MNERCGMNEHDAKAEEIRARWVNATRGPWAWRAGRLHRCYDPPPAVGSNGMPDGPTYYHDHFAEETENTLEQDREAIAAAPCDVAWLLADRERLLARPQAQQPRVGPLESQTKRCRERLGRLFERCRHVEARAVELKAKGRGCSYDWQEASALRWVLGLLVGEEEVARQLPPRPERLTAAEGSR